MEGKNKEQKERTHVQAKKTKTLNEVASKRSEKKSCTLPLLEETC
jgi:hypothetical protein